MKATQSRVGKLKKLFFSITFATAEKQGVVGVAEQSKAPNKVRPFTLPTMIYHRRQTTTPGTTCPTLYDMYGFYIVIFTCGKGTDIKASNLYL